MNSSMAGSFSTKSVMVKKSILIYSIAFTLFYHGCVLTSASSLRMLVSSLAMELAKNLAGSNFYKLEYSVCECTLVLKEVPPEPVSI